MIYPTRPAVVLMVIGAPVGLIAGVVAPDLWVVSAAWVIMVLALILLDAVLAVSGEGLALTIDLPPVLSVGRLAEAVVEGRFPRRAPARAFAAIEANDRLAVEDDRRPTTRHGDIAGARFVLDPVRRGPGEISRIWLRWRGPLGLIWRQKVAPGAKAPVIPDIAAVRDEAIRLFSRDPSFGVKVQRDTGEGAEFHALRDFQAGMDVRAIDWKQSARHSALLAKEFRTERNHQIIFAIDSGRVMSEPVRGMPRVDRAINAALLLAFISLKMGDRAGLFAFDDKVRVSTGAVSSVRGFASLQRLAAQIDYSTAETNFTLGLATLGGDLERRSLIVVFTDFPDSIAAEMMIENLQRLLKRHLVLFVAMRDEELETLVSAEPVETADVSRAVTAAALLRERDLVLARLRRMGVQVLEAPTEAIGTELVASYLELKRRNML